MAIGATGGMWQKVLVEARVCAQGVDVVIAKGGCLKLQQPFFLNGEKRTKDMRDSGTHTMRQTQHRNIQRPTWLARLIRVLL